MTISVLGIGWLTKTGYGCIATGERSAFVDAAGPDSLLKKEIFSYPVKNFGRFDRISRMTCFGVALALKDAGIRYSLTEKQSIGIVGTNSAGSLAADIEYFKDYINSGRTLSRGNLFIYTLPSSPLGEAAIHFGFLGPLLYVAGQNRSLVPLLDMAADAIEAEEAEMMVFGKAEPEEALFLVIGKKQLPEKNVSALCPKPGRCWNQTPGSSRLIFLLLKETIRSSLIGRNYVRGQAVDRHSFRSKKGLL